MPILARSSESGERIGSNRAKLLLLLPPFGALCYPFLLNAFHASLGSPGIVGAVPLILALMVPAVGVFVALKLGAIASPTEGDLQAKRIALLTVAVPAQFTFIGVVLTLVGDPISDVSLWVALWGLAGIFVMLAVFSPGVRTVPTSGEISPRLRMAHGLSAAGVVLLFLAMHLSNHLSGLWSEATHRFLMDKFRLVYRAEFVEPFVVVLFLFLVVSGTMLTWSYTRRSADIYRTVQIASGVYLIFFVLGHMNSVFVYARTFLEIQTDWDFATGAPTGLINDAWNIRLLPHYLFGVFFALTHLILGARVVALAHSVPVTRANSLSQIGIGVAALIAIAIIIGMVGLHLG